MVGINTNFQSTLLQGAIGASNSKLNLAMAKLSTGKRINKAADDAAGLSMMESLTAEIKGIEAASRNVADGVSLADTADGALSVIGDNLQEIRSLAVQASSDTLGADEKAAIQSEIDQRLSTISDIADSSSFNDVSLLDGSGGNVSVTSDADASSSVDIDVSGDFSSDAGAAAGSINEGNTGGAAGVALDNIDVTVGGNYGDILNGIDNAISNVSAKRSSLGASQNRLSSSLDSLSVSKTNIAASRSRIADANIAKQSSLAIQGMIQRQSSVSMLSQANSSSSMAFGLLPSI